MRYGLIGSVILHIVIFGLVIFNFAGSRRSDAPPPVPVAVKIMSPGDRSERQAGKEDGKAEQPPAPPAEVKAPDEQASAKKEVEQKPAPKPAEKEALPPPPKAVEPAKAPEPVKPAPKPVEQAKAETPPEKPAPKPVAKKPERKPVAKPKREEPKKIEEPQSKHAAQNPERNHPFDPNHLASILDKDAPQEPRPAPSQSMMDVTPSKNVSDRQTAVLNRDQNAGAPGGAYDPHQPWRPASSLQDQAIGLPNAHGSMNTGSCAEYIQDRIGQNWDLPIGGLSAERTVVRLHIELNPDGTLRHPPAVMDQASSPTYQAMADAAVRAAIKGQPYVLPPQQFERCRDIVLRFDPSEMYGG